MQTTAQALGSQGGAPSDPEIDLTELPSSRAADDGVLVIDDMGVVRYASENVARLLRLTDPLIGRNVDDVPIAAQLREFLRDTDEARRTVLVGGRYVEARRFVTGGAGRRGAVVLLRDRSELVALFAQLADVHAHVTRLRSREHERANRLHVVLGLMQVGDNVAAVDYLKDMLGLGGGADARSFTQAAATTLTALLRTKASIANARGVRLRADRLDALDSLGVDVDTLASIVGNLIDNAIDASAGLPNAFVHVAAGADADGIRLIVRDSGAGVPAGVDVFRDGYSTKAPRTPMARGFGLALVRHLVARSAGTITVHNDGGAVFTVRWPVRRGRGSSRLSARENEVVRHLAAGRTNRNIATVLFISQATVKRHVANIYAKLGARSRAEAIAKAAALGILANAAARTDAER